MSDTLKRVQELAGKGQIKISDHGYNELAADGLLAQEIINGLERAIMVEDYPTYAKGPCVLVLQRDAAGLPVHALWGIPVGKAEPAVLVTAYRPDSTRWDASFQRRR